MTNYEAVKWLEMVARKNMDDFYKSSEDTQKHYTASKINDALMVAILKLREDDI